MSLWDPGKMGSAEELVMVADGWLPATEPTARADMGIAELGTSNALVRPCHARHCMDVLRTC